MTRSLFGTAVACGLLLGCLLATSRAVRADNWPGWRGPTGMGHTSEKDLPLTWGGTFPENVLWKASLFPAGDKIILDQNQSSPIVWADRVFVTLAYWPAGGSQKGPAEHHVRCFRASDGRPLWDTRVPPGPWVLSDLRGGYSAPTPATDGERVYALFGSSVLAGLDVEGTIVWRKEITPHLFDVAIGTSPIVYRDAVLLLCDQTDKKASRLVNFDGKTGAVKWEQKRPQADWAHTTPVVAEVHGKTQLLVGAANGPQGLDPETGRLLWWCRVSDRVGDTVSPVYGSGLVYCDSGRGGPGVAVDPMGEGDVSKTHVKWKTAQVPGGFSSPIIAGDYLYRLHDPGVLKCWKLTTGEQVYAERLQDVSTASSPIATPEGRIYLASGGKSYVVQAGPEFKLLATNNLGDASKSSPAVSGGRIFIKGGHFLYCIGGK